MPTRSWDNSATVDRAALMRAYDKLATSAPEPASTPVGAVPAIEGLLPPALPAADLAPDAPESKSDVLTATCVSNTDVTPNVVRIAVYAATLNSHRWVWQRGVGIVCAACNVRLGTQGPKPPSCRAA